MLGQPLILHSQVSPNAKSSFSLCSLKHGGEGGGVILLNLY